MNIFSTLLWNLVIMVLYTSSCHRNICRCNLFVQTWSTLIFQVILTCTKPQSGGQRMRKWSKVEGLENICQVCFKTLTKKPLPFLLSGRQTTAKNHQIKRSLTQKPRNILNAIVAPQPFLSIVPVGSKTVALFREFCLILSCNKFE